MAEQLLLLLEDCLRRVDGAFIARVFNCCGLVGALEGAHCVLFLTGDRDDAAASWHLEDIVAMVGHCHKLGKGRIPKDGIVWETNVGNVEADELSVVVVALAEGDRKADVSYGNDGAIGHP